MSAVTVQEIVKALRKGIPVGAFRRFDLLEANKKLVERIEQHGIAPPDGMVLVPVDPTDAMQTAHDMYGDTSDWWNAVISAVIRAAAPEVKP
jgi:hypothetical protein